MKLALYYIGVFFRRFPAIFSRYVLGKVPETTGDDSINSGTTDAGKSAIEKFVDGPYNCSEAMLVTHAERAGIDPDLASGLSAPFAGGIAGKGKTCGALLAGMMIASQTAKSHGLKKGDIRVISAELYDSFEIRFQGVDCDVISAHDCEDPGAVPFDIRNCGKFMDFAINEADRIAKKHTGKAAPV